MTHCQVYNQYQLRQCLEPSVTYIYALSMSSVALIIPSSRAYSRVAIARGPQTNWQHGLHVGSVIGPVLPKLVNFLQSSDGRRSLDWSHCSTAPPLAERSLLEARAKPSHPNPPAPLLCHLQALIGLWLPLQAYCKPLLSILRLTHSLQLLPARPLAHSRLLQMS